jgi:glycolate oxidase FAD binding subunit
MARRTEIGVEGLTMTAVDRAPFAPASVDDVRDIVRDAVTHQTPLRIIGRGTWLSAGRPVAETQPVSLENLSGIVDYTPGDLTLTARAGTSLAEIAEATAPHGQCLALSPWGGDAGSLGATAATATAGPVSGAYGTPRDIVIGIEVVTGNADLVRGGGRVVKNVAGFDLTRLNVGAWGTLGIITEVSVRLRGLPDHEMSVAFPAPNAGPALAALCSRLRSAPIAPVALEIVTASLAATLGLEPRPTIVARLVGNAESVASQHEALAALTPLTDISTERWDALRGADPRDATIVRLSGPVGRFADVWLEADRLAGAGEGHAHGSILRSVARIALPHTNGSLSDVIVDSLRKSSPPTRIFERLPPALWPTLAPTAVADRLSLGVRNAFDPHRLFNRGILGETHT